MILNWFKTFNLDDFNATGLVSRTQTFSLKNIGDVDMTIYKGNNVSIMIQNLNNTFLSYDLNSKNPFVFEGYGIFADDNNDLWIGFTP